MVLDLGRANALVSCGSYVQLLVNDRDLANVDYYIIRNNRSNDKDFVDGLVDNMLG